MNYAYLYVNEYTGQDKIDFFDQLKKSVSVLKTYQTNYKIHVFTTNNSDDIINYCHDEQLIVHPISISKQYYDKRTIIDILAEKIRILRDFDPSEDVVLLDTDTLFLKPVKDHEWSVDSAVIWNIEYRITQFRNLDKVLPNLSWNDIGIEFDPNGFMYNSGVVYIPKQDRKEVCEVALRILENLNNGKFDPAYRYGNKLDEQIGLSIAIYNRYGKYGKVKTSDSVIYHFWEEKTKGIRWWETEQRVQDMDDVFKNLPQILDFVTPTSYLDIGANKGQNIDFIMYQLPSLNRIEMIEASRHHEWDLKQVSNRTGFPYHIEVLSDSIKKVNFFLDVDPSRPTAPGNSYYPEDTPYYKDFPSEERITNTLDNMYPNTTFDLIKLDTQGSELDIIKGGMNLISKAKALIIEENLVPFNVGAPLAKDIKSFLEDNNFVFVKYLKWWGGWIKNSNNESMWHEEVDSLYVRKDVFLNLPPLPISVGILAWNSRVNLENTLESYKNNGLFNAADDVVILFQEASKEDKDLAKKYNLPYIALDKNIGIGKGFVMLCEQADHPHVLLLEHDWELTENFVETRVRLKAALEMLQGDTDVVRLRSRKNPGYPLYSYEAYHGKELEHYDENIDMISPHLMDAIHWVDNPDQKFPGKIFTERGHYVATSRWANWTNNPCLHRKNFYIELVGWFADKGNLLEPEISHWWARQSFKIAAGEGLFTHNDLIKHKK